MNAPCVRVPTEDGEATRRRLADDDLVADGLDIVVEDGRLYVPVTDPDAVPADLDVVEHDVPERETITTPADLLGFEPSYERLGDVVIVDEDDPERAARIAEAIVDSDVRARTVLDRASKVKGETRVREWDVLATVPGEESAAGEASAPGEESAAETEARSPTETVHREYGSEFRVDVAEVYFSPRLATERHRVVTQVAPDERVFDMFAGVGPYAVPMAKRGAEVVAADVNPAAVEYLRENARRNGVDGRITAHADDVRAVAEAYEGWADRIVMNLPHTADAFLGTAVALAGEEGVLHFYDIQHEDDRFGPGERAIREAAEPDYEVRVETRHTVRSYAPHEYNVCLDVRLVHR